MYIVFGYDLYVRYLFDTAFSLFSVRRILKIVLPQQCV